MGKKSKTALCGLGAAAICIALSGAQSLANGFPEWCLDAIKNGDTEQALEYANMVLEGGRDFDKETADQAQACVKQATGKDVVYIPGTFEFITPQDRELRQDAARQALKLVAERRASVLAKLQDGCVELYRRDQASTITIPACFDYFLEVGLPE